jgi:hypothetical protein
MYLSGNTKFSKRSRTGLGPISKRSRNVLEAGLEVGLEAGLETGLEA